MDVLDGILQPGNPSVEDLMRLMAEEEVYAKDNAFCRKFWLRDKLPKTKVYAGRSAYSTLPQRERSRRYDAKDSLYSYNTYTKGLLARLENIRNEHVAVKSLEQYVLTLHCLGFSLKRIFFALMEDHKKYNIPIIFTLKSLKSYIQERWEFSAIKREYEESLKKERMEIFQDLHAEVRAEERHALESYIEIIKKLTAHLATLNPVTQREDCIQTRKDINMYLKDVNDAHGISDARKATVQAGGEAMKLMFLQKMKAESGEAPMSTANMMGNLLEAETV